MTAITLARVAKTVTMHVHAGVRLSSGISQSSIACDDPRETYTQLLVSSVLPP